MLKTLSDMTPDERQACVGMWCKMGEDWLIIMWVDGDEVGLTSPAWTTPFFETAAKITPRLGLPRAWMPDGTPVKGALETAADYDGLGNGFYMDSESPTHRRFITEWEEMP